VTPIRAMRALLFFIVLLAFGEARHTSTPLSCTNNVDYSEKSVETRNLVKTSLSSSSICANHFLVHDPTTKLFSRESLAFVTPWNNYGYDVAKQFSAKFDYISPVWYQIKLTMDQQFELTGKQDVDEKWLRALREPQPPSFLPETVKTDKTAIRPPKIMPRFLFDGWNLDKFFYMARKAAYRQEVIKLILDECMEQNYYGAVVDFGGVAFSPVQETIEMEANMASMVAVTFIEELTNALHDKAFYVFVALAPDRGYTTFLPPTYISRLAPAVDGWILMTYDYSSAYNPGPNAPYPWVESNVRHLLALSTSTSPREAKSASFAENGVGRSWASTGTPRVFMGLNFFGYSFVVPRGGGSITRNDFLRVIEQSKPSFSWDGQAREHVGKYSISNQEHSLYFPSLMSLSERLALIDALIEDYEGAHGGIAIWEIGQGLDYWTDLL